MIVDILTRHYPQSEWITTGAVSNADEWDMNVNWETIEVKKPTWSEIEPLLTQYEITSSKEQKLTELNDSCSSAIRAGFVSNALGSDHHYSTSSNEDQINLTGAVALGADIFYSCTDTATNKKQMRLHTHAQIKKVLSDGASEKTKLMQRYYDKVELVNAATTVEEIEAIVWGDK